jgi:hypothetical protein
MEASISNDDSGSAECSREMTRALYENFRPEVYYTLPVDQRAERPSTREPPSLHIRSQRDKTVQPKKANELFYIYVRIFIEDDNPTAGPAALSNIQCVIYKLHSSFKDRMRRSESRASNFEIKIWTYGWFKMSATVIPVSGPPFEIYGQVDFPPTPEEKQSNGAQRPDRSSTKEGRSGFILTYNSHRMHAATHH